jgi:epoxyqueuosine reductase QueG
MGLSDEITELLKQEGCPLVGFADLRCLPEEATQGFPYGIPIALHFTKEAMIENLNGLPQRYEDEHSPMDERFAKLKQLLSDFLTERGYEALIKTPASIMDGETLRSKLPQKTVATLAGVGWIGKTAVLVTEAFGSAVRLTSVLTNAPIECGTPVTQSKCPPNCTVCADICPAKASKGRLWEAGTDRDELLDAHACRAAARARGKEKIGIETAICGLCISSCPFTKRALGYTNNH